MNLALIERAQTTATSLAIVTPEAKFTYQDLLQTSAQIATTLLEDQTDLQEQRVAFLVPSGFEYVATQWGIWRAGGVAVPLCVSHPLPELEYVIANSGATMIVADPKFASLVEPIARTRGLRFLLTTAPLNAVGSLPPIDRGRRALILYTSGTTGKPKGVVTTHATLEAQITSLISAWGWRASDRILHVLPLHHIHGIVNILCCALWAGAECHMLPRFEAETVWNRIGAGDLTLFMAVPTIYHRLIAAWEAADRDRQQWLSAGCARMRLMVSGSAALPVQVLEQWRRISGQVLLERYGMTEIGMALSNPLVGERRPGYVGQPLPGVEVRLVDHHGEVVEVGSLGEIQVRGPGVFLEYWQKPEATAQAFRDGWFCTGDLAVVEAGDYRILGRISIDIIKMGGYKVSALEIEAVLLNHEAIQECAVVGVADPVWGEKVCAALVLKPDTELKLTSLRKWAKAQLAAYKLPTEMQVVTALPRNAMGKVMKPQVAQLFQQVTPT